MLQMDNDDSTETDFLPSLNEEHLKGQQDFERSDHSSGDYTIQQLKCFRNNVKVQVPDVFLVYSPTITEDNEHNDFLDESVVWLVGLIALIGTVVKCHTKNAAREGRWQNLYADTYGRLMLQAEEQ